MDHFVLRGGNAMEFLIEIVIGIYCELMLLIIPEEKASAIKYRKLATLLAIAGLLCTFGLFIWGCVLLNDYNNKFGAIPISIAIVISAAQIIAGMILYGKKSEK